MIPVAPAIAFARGNWKLISIGALIVALALVLAWAFRLDALRARHKAAHAETVERYTDAQKRAQEAFDAQIAAIQSQNRRLNDEADKNVADTTIVYRDRVIRLPTAPAQCAAGGAQLPSPNLPQSSDRSRAEAELSDRVVIKRDDALICADNTARLEAVREWALGMKAD